METILNNMITIIMGMIIGYHLSHICLDRLTFLNYVYK